MVPVHDGTQPYSTITVADTPSTYLLGIHRRIP